METSDADKITHADLAAWFGDTMPIDAVQLLNTNNPGQSRAELRVVLREMGEVWKSEGFYQVRTLCDRIYEGFYTGRIDRVNVGRIPPQWLAEMLGVLKYNLELALLGGESPANVRDHIIKQLTHYGIATAEDFNERVEGHFTLMHVHKAIAQFFEMGLR